MQWFKFYGAEYLIDPKMQTLTAADRSCWLTLLCYAAAADDGGRIRYLNEERVMLQSGLTISTDSWKKTKGIFKLFEKLGMVTLSDNGDVTIENWNKRQESYLTGAERMRRYRSNPANRVKENARRAVTLALRSGALIQKPCESCSDANAEAHHESYEEKDWLKVRWFCKKHHEQIHSTIYLVTQEPSQRDGRIDRKIDRKKESSKEDKNTTNTEFAAHFKKGRDILNSKKKLT